jgi:hypothetical protein
MNDGDWANITSAVIVNLLEYAVNPCNTVD